VISLQILLAIPEDRIQRMQRRLGRVWHRFAYTRGKMVNEIFTRDHRHNTMNNLPKAWRDRLGDKKIPLPPELQNTSYPWPVLAWPHPSSYGLNHDDAFGTIMQWLYSRIPWARELRDK
jgi:hypothetical protein